MKNKYLMLRPFSFILTIVGCLAVQELYADPLLSETFISGERLTQNLPNTAAWYSSYSSGYSDSTGDLVSLANRHLLTYFTGSGSPQQLGVGDSLTVSFTFSLQTPVSTAAYGAIGFGLFNSGGSRISADNHGTSNTAFTDYSGYASFMNINASSAMKLAERNISGVKLINSYDSYTRTGSLGSGTDFINNQDYTMVFDLTRTADGMEVSAALSGVTGFSGLNTYTTGIETAFDTFAIYVPSAYADGYTLKSVDITAVPEPATIGMLGLGALGLLVVRRLKM